MRHAEAQAAPRGHADFERRLTARGNHDARAMGQYLRRNWPELALVVCSSATRTRETAFNVLEAFRPTPPRLSLEPTLYLAEAETLLAWIQGQSTTPLLLIGHNPGLEDLVRAILKPTEHVKFTGLSPAELVALTLETQQPIGDVPTAHFIAQIQPRQLGADQT